MQITIDLAVAVAHLQRDCVVDPVTDRISVQCPVRNRRGEREIRRVQVREIEVKIDSNALPGAHRTQLIAFACRVGSSKIDSEVIAHHEADIRRREARPGENCNSYDRLRARVEQAELAAELVADSNACDLGPPVAKAVIDIRNT